MPKKKQKKSSFSASTRYLLVLFIALLILLGAFDTAIFTGGDNAQYITLAKSIINGRYHNEAFIGSPVEAEIPPGYPLIISPLIALFPNTYIPTKLLSLVCMLLAFLIVLKLFERFGIPPLATSIFVIAMALNPAINEFSHWTLTEAPYFLISLLGVYLFDAGVKSKSLSKFIGASAVAVLSIYIRPVGAALIIGGFLYLLFRKEFRRGFIFLAVAVIIYGPWFIRNQLVKTGAEGSFYLANFLSKTPGSDAGAVDIGNLISRIGDNLGSYLLRDIPTVITGFLNQANLFNGIIGVIFVVIGLIGAIKLFLKRSSVIPYYVVIYLATLMVYSSAFATFRFIMPLSPLLIILLWRGLELSKPLNLEEHSRKIITGFAVLAVLLTAVSYFPVAKRNTGNSIDFLSGKHNLFAGQPQWRSFYDACKWIEGNTPEDANLISRKPRMSYIFSNRRGSNYLYSPSPAKVIADIDSAGADYVIIDRLSGTTQQYLIPAVNGFRYRFVPVYVSPPPETYVLKILSEEEATQRALEEKAAAEEGKQ